ncbi:hypothetical protein D3C73_1557960 [compost metagenome]
MHRIDSDFITEIILGCKFREKDKLPFVTKLLEVYPHIVVSEMKLNNEKFELEKIEVFNNSSILL